MSHFCQSQIPKIHEIFESMDYGSSPKKRAQKYTPVANASKDNRGIWADANTIERCEKLQSFAEEIVNNASVFGKLSPGDADKNVQLLAQYICYYSSFSIKLNNEWKPKGSAVFVAESGTPLWSLGLFLGPTLAAGYKVALQVDGELFECALLLRDLSEKVCIPLETICVNDKKNLSCLQDESVETVTIFGDLRRDTNISNNLHKKILNLAPLKTPLLIFEGADMDSATECAINAIWTSQFMKPWSVDTVLVQENIFETFIKKLKTNLTKLESFASSKDIDSAIIVGEKLSTNKVLKSDNTPNNVVSVLPFRTIDEGVNLANNGRQGFSASVWSENVSLINEVARKLKVSNVWVNSFGLFSPEVPFSPLKDSGTGYFGGPEGFHQYINVNSPLESCNADEMFDFNPNLSVVNAVALAKKAQESWERVNYINKVGIFQKIAKNCSKNLKEEIYKCVLSENKQNHDTSTLGYMVTSLQMPLGVMAIECNSENELKLIFSALLEGNAVILITNETQLESTFKEMNKYLPSNIFTVFPNTIENIQALSSHNELNAYIGCRKNLIYGSLPIKDSKVFNLYFDRNNVAMNVTVVKNIWTTVGQSSQCNF